MVEFKKNEGPITNGTDFNFFEIVTVNKQEFMPNGNDDADVFINIKNQITVSLCNYGGQTVEYSFNGTTVHGDMRPGTPTQAIFFDNRKVSKVWFRVPSGLPVEMRVEAWGGF